MAIIRLQGDKERVKSFYYEFDSEDRPLGEGGMGKVYKGRCVDERRGIMKDVAIKFLFSELPDHAIERARREASIQLRNDNLVEMLGFIETSQKNVIGETVKRYHVVSELLEGVILDDLLQGKITDRNGDIIPFAEKLYRDFQNNPLLFAVTVIKSVLSGLMALHDAGYIHRDIDPTNIMVTKQGHIKLIDFGIAKPICTLTTIDKALTTAGVFMGKPWYAAPELVLGDVKHQNVTTDIYAIGILFYQLYMGVRPFDGEHYEVLDMQLHKKMPISSISNKLVKNIIAKATDKKQSNRYQSATEFRVAVDQINPHIPDPSPFPWKKCLIGGVVITAFTILCIGLNNNEDIENNPIYLGKNITYQEAVDKLRIKGTANEGLQALEKLSDEGNYAATYLLSKLKFNLNEKKDFDIIPDSIGVLKFTAGIKSDYKMAHDLLVKAVSINSNDYHSLYDLGCDYLVGDRKTLEGRNLKKAKECFDKALSLAQQDGNQEIVSRVQKILKDFSKDFNKAK